jgi:hypothetical protein
MAILQNTTVSGSLVITGDLTARQFILSSSVTFYTESFSSGSTRFGDSVDDVMQMTGSFRVSGSTGGGFVITGSTGNVGIGTLSPNLSGGAAGSGILTLSGNISGRNAVLELNGTRVNSTDITGYVRFYNNAAATPLADIQAIRGTSDVSGSLAFFTNNAERMRFDTAGNVGIGTDNPGFRLHVLATGASMGLFSTTSATGGFVGFRYNTNTTIGYVGNGNQLVTGGGVGDISLTAESGNILFATNAGAERMRITSGGNVGIGTTNPVTYGTRNLEVNGGTGVAYIVARANSNAEIVELAIDGGVGYLSTKSNHPLRLRTNDTSRVIITSIASGGYFKASNDGVFINTAGNYHELTSARANDNVVYLGSTSASPYGPFVWFINSTPNNTTNYFLGCTDSTNDKALIYSNGTFGSRTGTYGSIISDEKYKQDITDANSQWDDIKNLKVRNFKYKEDVQNEGDNALRQIGFIAQEVELVSPGLVYEAGKKGSDETWKSVKTSIIEIKAIKALQEAMAKIEQLEAKVTALENK